MVAWDEARIKKRFIIQYSSDEFDFYNSPHKLGDFIHLQWKELLPFTGSYQIENLAKLQRYNCPSTVQAGEDYLGYADYQN